MSIPSELSRINGAVSQQADLLAQIQTALEGKTGGSGGASVETCTVTIPSIAAAVGGTSYENGEFVPVYLEDQGGVVSGTLNNIVCGSLFSISMPSIYTIIATGAEQVAQFSSVYANLFKITASAGETVTFEAIYND